jgi:hypothetical protein
LRDGAIAEFRIFGGGMKMNVRRLCLGLVMAVLPCISAFAQKINVGYDRGVDFSRYTSYTWAAPGTPPARPLLYASIVGSIDQELKSKGLAKRENDGELIVIPAGGMEFGFNTAVAAPIIPSYTAQVPAINATMWTGSGSSLNLMAPYVPEGTLMLSFVDRGSNKVIWTGTVTLKLDMEQKQKSLNLIDKAITKLLKRYPPEKK